MGWEEFIGKIAVGGWGEDVLRGLIPAYLKRISLDECHEYIVTNRSLLQGVNENTWQALRRIARSVNINITLEEVIKELQKNRPDVLGVILNTPGGREWLARQVDEIKVKLTS